MARSGIFSLEDIKRYRIQYQPAGLIVDTNVLLLLLVGKYSVDYIKNCEKLKNSDKRYTVEDFRILENIISHFRILVITPHVITEISKHSMDIKKNLSDERFASYLRSLIKVFSASEEKHQPCACLWGLEIQVLARFGVTDMTLIELAKSANLPVLTDDQNLYDYGYAKQVPIIKFSHIKNHPLQTVFAR